MKRAPLSPDLQALRAKLPDLLGTLEAERDWYGSVYVERKSGNTFSVNLKQSQISDSATQGVVLRIYDGYTLYEQATDQTEIAELQKEARALVERVRAARVPAGAVKRPYPAPTWKDRLATTLDPDLRSQIPDEVTARTPVHFGVSFRDDPVAISSEARLKRLKELIARTQKIADDAGFGSSQLSFILFREGMVVEEALFLDRESNLSQTLYRVSLTALLMSGSNRAVNRFGGLGGAEAVAISDDRIRELVGDLQALKQAERLKPGRYRILIGPTVSGVLAHEAFGHSQEGDTCARGRSKAWELSQSGEKVGNPHATILNNPAVYRNATEPSAAWGSYFFDEEGWFAQEQVLLESGVLKNPMTNLTSALRLGVPRSANGKRESWQNGVYTRQTNTYFSPGTRTYDELLAQIEDGFFAMNPAGGMEDPKGMGIQVGIQYLKEVKHGKFTGRVFKGPAGGDIQLTGYVPEVLNSIVDKSKIEAMKKEPDSAQHPFNDCGGCGKYHKELVFAGCGGPYMLLDNILLG